MPLIVTTALPLQVKWFIGRTLPLSTGLPAPEWDSLTCPPFGSLKAFNRMVCSSGLVCWDLSETQFFSAKKPIFHYQRTACLLLRVLLFVIGISWTKILQDMSKHNFAFLIENFPVLCITVWSPPLCPKPHWGDWNEPGGVWLGLLLIAKFYGAFNHLLFTASERLAMMFISEFEGIVKAVTCS